jgi:ABC-type multidrug transport system fused ATPase/permease subunit
LLQPYSTNTAHSCSTLHNQHTLPLQILRHDIGWFDSEDNGTGPLTTRLEEDASAMAKATGMALGHKVQLCMTLLLGIFVGLIAAWQVGLVAICCIPLIGTLARHFNCSMLITCHCVCSDVLKFSAELVCSVVDQHQLRYHRCTFTLVVYDA